MITEGNGVPLAATLTGANRHDVTQLLPLVDGVPPVRGKRGRPRRRPQRLYADRAYDSREHRQGLRTRHITPLIAKRGTGHGSGLGVYRYSAPYERRDDIHESISICRLGVLSQHRPGALLHVSFLVAFRFRIRDCLGTHRLLDPANRCR